MIRFDSIALTQGSFHLSNICFEVPKGAYAVLMGPTGCGKTTVLELLCGLRAPLAGSIQINDRDVTNLTPGARGVGYVPQDGALFPRLTVGEQVGFSLRVRHLPESEVTGRVAELGGGVVVGDPRQNARTLVDLSAVRLLDQPPGQIVVLRVGGLEGQEDLLPLQDLEAVLRVLRGRE